MTIVKEEIEHELIDFKGGKVRITKDGDWIVLKDWCRVLDMGFYGEDQKFNATVMTAGISTDNCIQFRVATPENLKNPWAYMVHINSEGLNELLAHRKCPEGVIREMVYEIFGDIL